MPSRRECRGHAVASKWRLVHKFTERVLSLTRTACLRTVLYLQVIENITIGHINIFSELYSGILS